MGNLEPSNAWEAFCVPEELAFRAACNAAVDPSARPVKRRVIGRLSQSNEARRLFAETWDRAVSLGTPQPTAFFQLLTELPSWQTLVIEQIAAERRWSDVRSKNTDTLVEKIKSFAEKFWDKREHPSAAALTRLGLGLSMAVAFTHTGVLTIPVKTSLDGKSTVPVTLSLDDKDRKPFRVSFVPTGDPAQIPIKVEVNSGKPITLQVDAEQCAEKTLEKVVAQLRASNQSLAGVASGIHSVADQAAKLDGEDLRSKLQGISDKINASTTELQKMDQAIHADLGKQSTSETTNAQYVNRQLAVMTRAALTPKSAITLSLSQGASQSVILPSFTPDTGKFESSTVEVQLVGIGQGEHGKTLSVKILAGADSECDGCDNLTEGTVAILKNKPWKLVVNSIEKHWYRSRASVTLFEDMGELPLPTLASSPPSPDKTTAQNDGLRP